MKFTKSDIDTDINFREINITLFEPLDVIFKFFIYDATYFLELQVDLEVFLNFEKKFVLLVQPF